MWWVDKLGHDVFGKKLFHFQGFVRWRVVVVKPQLCHNSGGVFVSTRHANVSELSAKTLG
jgi:hypothetical protein